MIKNVIRNLLFNFKLIKLKIKWRKVNSNNYTNLNNIPNIFPIEKVTVGKYSYGPLNITYFGNENEKLVIGNYCSISSGVKFILGGEHHPEFLMNYPFKLFNLPNNDVDDRRTKGTILVGDDVWIGTDSLILSGVTIGQGAIIAAGSVISKNVPPYSICSTNRIIKYRFSQDIIDKLVKIDFSILDLEFVKNNIELFYSKNIDEILNSLTFAKFLEDPRGETF